MKKALIAIIIVIIAGLFIWRVGIVIKAKAQAKVIEEATAVPVGVKLVTRGTIQNELSFVGNIVADAEVMVFPKTAGRIEQIMVEVGNNVNKGAVLAKLEDKELSLRVKQAEVALETAKTAYAQAKALAEVKVRSQVAQAEAGLLGAEASLRQVQDIAETRISSQLEQAEAGLEALKTNLKKIKDGARPEEKKQIEATVQQAKANMDNAKADLDRIEKLYAEGAVSKQTLDGAKTRATVAEAQYEAATQQLKLVETGAREEDIKAMELQVKSAESGLAIARSMWATKSWEKDISLAQSHYNQAKAGYEAAKALEKARSWEAEIAGAEAGVKQAETALALAKEALSYATVTAPISGTISKRNLDTGAMANPAMPMFTIVNMNNVKAIVEAPEANLKDISVGTKAFISSATLSEPIAGQVTLISPIVKPTSRTASVEISIDNSDRRLKPGTFAKINIPLSAKNDAVIVNRSAVMEERNNGGITRYVYVVVGDKAVRRNVEIGIESSDKLEIISGVQPNDKVVVSGQNLLKDNEKVKIAEIVE
ncbi:MAG: efflux RND transporter periplasmic adaptor subunit [Candidatus Poribacteria bacterium]